MRISVRLGRNTRLSMGPVGWLVFLIFVGPFYLMAIVLVLLVQIIAALARTLSKPSTATAALPKTPAQLRAEAVERADKVARRQAAADRRTASKAAARAAKAEMVAHRQAAVARRRADRAAVRAARGQRGWPKWGLIAAIAGVIASVALAGVAGKSHHNAAALASEWVGTISFLALFVTLPVVIWRWWRAMRVASVPVAVVLAEYVHRCRERLDAREPCPGN